MEKDHTYRIEVTADRLLWDNMNIYTMIFAGDAADEKMRRAEHEAGTEAESLIVESPEKAEYATACIYVVPHFLPESNEVGDSPELKLTYEIFRDGISIEKKAVPINRWAGLQLVGLRYE